MRTYLLCVLFQYWVLIGFLHECTNLSRHCCWYRFAQPCTCARAPVADLRARPDAAPECLLPADPGSNCEASSVVMWYYNAVSKRCENFRYGGCDGNANRFATEAQCEARCRKPSECMTSQRCRRLITWSFFMCQREVPQISSTKTFQDRMIKLQNITDIVENFPGDRNITIS